MPLQAFSLPFPQTRLFEANSIIYQFQIIGGNSFRRGEVIRGDSLNEELEEIIRTVIGNLDNLQPFSSAHFSVYPYKKRWGGVTKVVQEHGKRKPSSYPFSIILYLEKNMQNEKQAEQGPSSGTEAAQQFPSVSKLPSKCNRGDSPLEDAIIKALSQDMEVEGKVSAAGRFREDPGHDGKKSTRGFNDPQEKSSASTVIGSGTPGKVHPGTTEHDMREEEEEEKEEGDEDEENADSVPGTPLRPGILTQLASHIFPFSLFFKDP